MLWGNNRTIAIQGRARGGVMPELTVEFEAFCECGNGLCGNISTRNSYNRNIPQIVVEPCEKCMERVREEGKEEGYKEGVEEAENAE